MTESTIWRKLVRMHNPAFAERVHAVRQFTRFYTKELGILHERLLSSPYSLA
ncbi:MAG: hypothetical protein JOZ44_00905, partial [Acidobacteria bacterium]|nr:hypothetical protein [Acidobacteriota bacterium]